MHSFLCVGTQTFDCDILHMETQRTVSYNIYILQDMHVFVFLKYTHTDIQSNNGLELESTQNQVKIYKIFHLSF